MKFARRHSLKRKVVLLAAGFLLVGCAMRPLSDAETAFSETVLGSGLDVSEVSLTKGALVGTIPLTRPPRPYLTCRERIYPEETEPEIKTSIGGFVYNNSIQIARRYFSPDYLSGYPGTLPLAQAMFLAHELTHVWQWQNRRITGYAPLRAANEHSVSEDPYLFELENSRSFFDYGYEQQASLVEEFVCCRALDPNGARTERLYATLKQAFPDLTRYSDPATQHISLPWSEATTVGICS